MVPLLCLCASLMMHRFYRSSLYLISVFEMLLTQVHPLLRTHLTSLGVIPAQMAFSWCYTGFVHLLSPAQVLILWDRLLGYMDLTLLPLFAVAVFLFRAEALLQVSPSTCPCHFS